MHEYICKNEKYAFGGGYIHLPVEINNLPTQITVGGSTLHLKTEFHCSLVCVKCMATKLDKELDDLKTEIVGYFCEFVSRKDVSLLKYRNEFRYVKDGERESVVVMCDVSNIKEFFESINEKLGTRFDTQPTHVTLYTLQPNIGIGIPDASTFDKITSPFEATSEIRQSLDIA